MREAHPTDNKNDRHARNGPQIAQAKSEQERANAASECVRSLKLSWPVVIDNMEGTTERAYHGWPARLLIIDTEGRIKHCNRGSPDGANPRGAAEALDELLAKKTPTSRPASGS